MFGLKIFRVLHTFSDMSDFGLSAKLGVFISRYPCTQWHIRGVILERCLICVVKKKKNTLALGVLMVLFDQCSQGFYFLAQKSKVLQILDRIGWVSRTGKNDSLVVVWWLWSSFFHPRIITFWMSKGLWKEKRKKIKRTKKG